MPGCRRKLKRRCKGVKMQKRRPRRQLPTEVGPLTACLLLSSRVDGSSSQGAGAKLQTKRIPLILHIARGRSADRSASVPILKN